MYDFFFLEPIYLMAIPTVYGLYGPSLEFRQREEVFSPPDCLWNLHSLLNLWQPEFFPGSKIAGT